MADDGPAPGAGAVAAIVGAAAAALTTAVARASSSWAEAGGVTAQAETLRARLMRLAPANAATYEAALATLAGSSGQAAPRRDALLAEALDRSAALPLEIADIAANVAELAALVAEDGDPACRGDAASAALLAEGAARAAAHLVRINLGTVQDDERARRAESVVKDAAAAAERALASTV